jgi:hypothetical protein
MLNRIRRRRKERSTNRRPRVLGFQQLETRELFSVDILTVQVPGAVGPVADVPADVAQNQNVANPQQSSACVCEVHCDLTATGPFCRSRIRPNGANAGQGGQASGSIDPVSHPDKFRHPGHQGSTGSSIDPLSDPSRFRHPDHQQPNRGSM